MSQQKTRAYERLQELHQQAITPPSVSEGPQHVEWTQSVEAALRRLFGTDSVQLKEFKRVSYSPGVFYSGQPNSDFIKAYQSGVRTAVAIIAAALREFEDYEVPAHKPSLDGAKNAKRPGKRVFIVHGHETAMKESVARFLERLGLEAIILHEQANAGQTIIEKFERESDADFAVVLFSPDDVGAEKDKMADLKPRARQNVVLELGYFIGKLGRQRVLPLVHGQLELPSDVHGVVYVSYEGEGW